MRGTGNSFRLATCVTAVAAAVLVVWSTNPLGPVDLASAAPNAAPERAPTSDLAGGDRNAGRIAFRSQCQECHPQGRQSFEPESRGRLSQLATTIREGDEEMPAFPPNVLQDDVLAHVLAYIAHPAEPEVRPEPQPRVRGVNAEILDATVSPGQPATVRVRVKDDQGVAFAPGALASLAVTIGGPTIDYRWFVREDIRARAQAQPDGSLQYVFAAPLPADASGSAAVAIESSLVHLAGTAGPAAVTEYAYNPVRYFALTDPAPVPHPTIVQTETCNGCHGALALHGGGRRNVELCVICHNAVVADTDKRNIRAGPMPPESVLFSNMVHRIHTNEDLTKPFIIYGGAATNVQPVDLAAIEPFPEDRANCAVCHQQGTFNITPQLAAKTGVKVTVGGNVVRQMGPITAACTGCHDSDQATAHAVSPLAGGGDAELCGTCHGTGRQFSPTAVHRVESEWTRPRTQLR